MGRLVAALVAVAIVVILAPGIVPQPPNKVPRPADFAAASSPSTSPQAPALATPTSTASRVPTVPSLSPPTTPTPTPVNLYAHTRVGMLSPVVAALKARVYVPDEVTGTVVVIDPSTFRIVDRYAIGASPEHVTPDWDLRRLYVEAAFGNRLTVIDAATGQPVGKHAVPGPYNLYFTVDGMMAIVVLDSTANGAGYGSGRQISFYDRRTWHLIKALDIPYAGANHLDFSADGSYFLLSTEYAGRLVKVGVAKKAVIGVLRVGGSPVDVRVSPEGNAFYVANQRRNGVSVIDPVKMREIEFLPTGRGAHGLAISRDSQSVYVTNRLAGSLSVIDFLTRKVVKTWRVGGSPDMIAVSPDGMQLWISNRYGGTVSIINAQTGAVIKIVRVGGRPHGLAYFPEPGRFSLGHNGMYR